MVDEETEAQGGRAVGQGWGYSPHRAAPRTWPHCVRPSCVFIGSADLYQHWGQPRTLQPIDLRMALNPLGAVESELTPMRKGGCGFSPFPSQPWGSCRALHLGLAWATLWGARRLWGLLLCLTSLQLCREAVYSMASSAWVWGPRTSCPPLRASVSLSVELGVIPTQLCASGSEHSMLVSWSHWLDSFHLFWPSSQAVLRAPRDWSATSTGLVRPLRP